MYQEPRINELLALVNHRQGSLESGALVLGCLFCSCHPFYAIT